METAVLRAERPDFALNTALPKRTARPLYPLRRGREAAFCNDAAQKRKTPK